MAEVKWIKITTTMFDDEKIRLIEAMPEKDTVLIIWIKLLVLAGKCNNNGYIYLSENIPYTVEMLATLFNRPLNTVRMALETFKNFGMVDIDDNQLICISNWEKHQNIQGMEKIKEQNRKRVAAYRAKKKALELPVKEESCISGNEKETECNGKEINCNVTCNITETKSNATDIDKDIDKDKDIKHIKSSKQDIPYSEIINYLNEKAGTKYKSTTKKTQTLIHARWEEGFILEDFKKVIENKSIEWLNTDMEKYLRPETLFGTKFEGYLNQKAAKPKTAEKVDTFNNYEQRAYDYDELEKKLLGWKNQEESG